MQSTVALVGSSDRDFLAGLRERGYKVASVALEDLDSTYPPGSKGPDAFIFDTRGLERLPREVAQAKKMFPTTGVVIVARALEPTAMLEAMRVGVNEWVADPLELDEVAAALRRVARAVTRPMMGRAIAILGAKGGVGSTTVAVNLATALHKASQRPTLLIDLHLAHGDAAVFMGVDPRFSVLDAIENIHRLDETYLKGLVVPTNAVNTKGDMPWVLRVTDGKTERVNVTLGLRDPRTERIAVTAGLSDGDMLLRGASQGIAPGTPVQIGGRE